MKRIIAIVMLAAASQAADVVLGRLSELSWTGTGVNKVAAWGSADVLDGLVAWWKLDGADGIYTPDSINAYTGTVVNSASFVPGKVNNAILLNGTSQRVDTGFDLQLANFSVSVWFNRDPYGTRFYDRIVDKNYETGFVISRKSEYANIWGVYFMDVPAASPITVTLVDGQWHNIIVVRSGTLLTVYGDGGAVTKSGLVSSAPLDSSTLSIGWSSVEHGYNYFKGKIDDVRIYNRALSSDEVNTIYNRFR